VTSLTIASATSSIDREQHRGVVLRPPRCVAPRDALDLLAAMPAARNDDVLLPLVVGVPERGHPQDGQLPIAGRERRGGEDVPVEGVVRVHQGRVVGQGAQHVETLGTALAPWQLMLGIRRPQEGDRLHDLVRPLVGRQWRDAGPFAGH
jgi:hypothetical protein